jgi:hypothetical protein
MFEPDVMDEKQFHETEHIWIYDLDHIINLAKEAGLKVLDMTQWKLGHEQIVFVK